MNIIVVDIENPEARNMKNRTSYNKFITIGLIVIIIIILMLPPSASELVLENSAKSTNLRYIELDHTNSDTPDPTNQDNPTSKSASISQISTPGYIFPATVNDHSGIAVDYNNNGIEDFIERMSPTYSDHEYIDAIVTLTEPVSDQLVKKLETLGCIIDHKFSIIDAVGVTIPTNKLPEIGRLPTIEMIQSIHEVKPHLAQGVPIVKASQDILKSAGYNGLTGEGVTIAVLDSGIDGDHSTFGNRIIAFRDFISGNNDLDPTNGMNAYDSGYHGTMTSSCAAGSGAYKGVAIGSYIIGVAVWSTYQMVQGIEWCVNNKNKDFNQDGEPDGPDIITMSLGLATNQRTYLDTAAESAMDQGVLFVTSAGNDGPGSGTVTSPATSSKVISVGAINKNKNIADFSSRGPGPGGILKPDVVAPGVAITCAYPGNTWTSGGYGTSFSCPIVAGIAALLLQYDPELSPYEIKQVLHDSAEDRGDSGPDNTYGWGIANAVAALDLVLKVKSIVASEYSVVEDTKLVFSATASGTNVKEFDWDFDNDGDFDLTTETGTASYTYTNAGEYEIRVRITNTQGKTAENSIIITVNNRKPTASLEIDSVSEYLYEDQPIAFNSSQSWDTISDINDLEFSWSFDGGLNFTDYSKENKTIQHIFKHTGQYNIKVKVRDDNNEEEEEEVTIIIYNMKPTADAGGDKIALEDEIIHFSGFNSIDTKTDLMTLKYVWDFGDGIKGYEMNMTHSYLSEYNNKVYTVTLTVTDNDNERSQDKIKVTVYNQPPIILPLEDKIGDEDTLIEFYGMANDSKNDQTLLKYKWIFDDGESTDWLEEPTAFHSYSEVGTYHPEFQVLDPKDAVSSKTFNVTIYNIDPIADFTMNKSKAEEDELIKFNASVSYDTVSDIESLKYAWDFGDGSIGHGMMINHQFCKTGSYSIILTITDDDGATASIEKRVSVTNRDPIAVIKIDKDEFEIDELVRVYGHDSKDTPSDQFNLTYSWNFGDDTGWDLAGINATHKYSKAGNYEIRLKVEDDDGGFNIKKVTIQVIAEEEKEDIFANPTMENSGLLIYALLGVLVVILILILLSLWMYYRNKKGIFGKLEKTIKDRKLKKSVSNVQQPGMAGPGGPSAPVPGYPGMTPEQLQFYYGMPPSQAQQPGVVGSPPQGWPQTSMPIQPIRPIPQQESSGTNIEPTDGRVQLQSSGFRSPQMLPAPQQQAPSKDAPPDTELEKKRKETENSLDYMYES